MDIFGATGRIPIESTIVLDGIGDVSPLIQLELLPVIQAREFERFGGAKSIEVDVRVVTAASKPLKQLMAYRLT